MHNTVIRPSDVVATRRRAMISYKYRLETSRRPNFVARYSFHCGLGDSNNIFYAVYALTNREILIKGVTNLCNSENAEIHCVTEPFVLQIILCSHPNIVHLLDVLRAPDNNFVLEFEYHPLGSLATHVYARGGVFDYGIPYSMDEMLAVAHQISDALVYCHSRYVVHADIKLDNILVAHNGTVKLADFGSAHILEEGASVPCYEVNPTGHRPPEILLGLAWSFSVDLWSLGCTLVELHCLARGLNHPFLYDTAASAQDHLRRVCEFAGPVPELMLQAAGVIREGGGGVYSSPACIDFCEMAEENMELYQLTRRMLVTEPSQRITAAATVVWTSHRPFCKKVIN